MTEPENDVVEPQTQTPDHPEPVPSGETRRTRNHRIRRGVLIASLATVAAIAAVGILREASSDATPDGRSPTVSEQSVTEAVDGTALTNELTATGGAPATTQGQGAADGAESTSTPAPRKTGG